MMEENMDLTDQDKFELKVDHILRDHSWYGQPKSTDLVTLTMYEHPMIHKREGERVAHAMVPHPED
jgi:hypothetical protein